MYKLQDSLLSALSLDGFTITKAALEQKQLIQLASKIEVVRKSHSSPGMRHLLSRSNAVKDFALSGVPFEIASKILGKNARPVRAILFDKTPTANWYVTWHQDVTIPVRDRIEVDGFRAWSTKGGVQHVQPPAHILEEMVSLRIHFDASPEDNGAIKFLPGSHQSGILDELGKEYWRESADPVICAADAGDIIVMRPLILHSSSKADKPVQRRVLHIEYAGCDLPSGLQWAES